MKALLYKDLKLGVSPVFYILPLLTGALMLIPGWVYFFVMMYFCFITAPNMLAMFRSSNDLQMSVLMPVKKKDIVKARVMTIVILEVLHLLVGIIYAIINAKLYKDWYFIFVRPNMAYFGLALIIFGVFNLVLLPIYYKSGYKYGFPVLLGNGICLLLATGIELLNIYQPQVRSWLAGTYSSVHLGVLFGGIIIFAIMSIIAYYRAKTNFEQVDV